MKMQMRNCQLNAWVEEYANCVEISKVNEFSECMSRKERNFPLAIVFRHLVAHSLTAEKMILQRGAEVYDAEEV